MSIWTPGARLHLGCGSHIMHGWLNVDGARRPMLDAVMDFHRDLPKIPDNVLSWIYTSHVVEHWFPDMVPGMLRHLHRALQPGGKLTIATTDIDGIYKNWYLTNLNDGYSWAAALFGQTNSADHPFDAHRDCFNYAKLERLLLGAGFASVRQWSVGDYPEIAAHNDFAFSCAAVTCYAEGVK